MLRDPGGGPQHRISIAHPGSLAFGFTLRVPGMTASARHFPSAAANSTLLSWPPKKTSRPPISGSTASTRRPVEVEPVASLTQPIRYGPPKPARLPLELISAIAPAAAVH